MAHACRSSGLSRADVVVSTVIILFLGWLTLSFALPAYMRVHVMGLRVRCLQNLSSIGKAMLTYAQDYDGVLPVAGGPDARWGPRLTNWIADDAAEAFGLEPGHAGGSASVSSSLYLLVRSGRITPDVFVCPADRRATAFVPAKYRVQGKKLTDLWDFGPEPPKHVSYSYHMQYSPFRLTRSSEPGMAVAADRNPWMDSPFAKARDFSKFKPDVASHKGTTEHVRAGNSAAHQADGQCVLFLDTHVDFVKVSGCGLEEDNIYTFWDGDDKIRGKPPTLGSEPADHKDSLLVNDPPVPPLGGQRQKP
jgi:hypothetical protein